MRASSFRPAVSDRRYPEQELVHRPIIQLVEMHLQTLPALSGLIHVPNEGNRSRAGHGILIGLGMRPGVSDLLLLRARRGFHGLAMELKAPGKLKTATPEQRSFLRQQRDEGWLSIVCDDAQVGWLWLQWYAGESLYGNTPSPPPSPHAIVGGDIGY